MIKINTMNKLKRRRNNQIVKFLIKGYLPNLLQNLYLIHCWKDIKGIPKMVNLT